MGRTKPDIFIGSKFGMLTLLSVNMGGKYRLGTFLCDCGKLTEKQFTHVNTGKTRSCGCYKQRASTERATTHGMSMRQSEWAVYLKVSRSALNGMIRKGRSFEYIYNYYKLKNAI